MDNVRFYGDEPYKVVLIEGNPSTMGSMGYAAEIMSETFGVVEILQKENTIEGQISEIYEIISDYCSGFVTIVGHSWGAWLAYMVASRYPKLISKLVMVSAGPFENILRQDIKDMNVDVVYNAKSVNDSKYIMANENLHQETMWEELLEMSLNGDLLAMAKNISAKVYILKGDHDSRSLLRVVDPLNTYIKDLKVLTMQDCGNVPWKEKSADEQFFTIVNDIVNA